MLQRPGSARPDEYRRAGPTVQGRERATISFKPSVASRTLMPFVSAAWSSNDRGLDALPEPLRAALLQRASETPPPCEATEVAPDEAVAVLLQTAQVRRVVILAEEHMSPEHRAFGARLLPAFQAAGVTHLAIETGPQASLDEARNSRRVSPTTDGFSYEPQRAALLRAALALDLPIVAFDVDGDEAVWMHDHPDQAMAFREQRMAEHLVERVLRPDPTARVLIWVGHGHAQKVDMGVKMMALHLWHMTGEEPFSAYQLTGPGRRPGVDLLIRHSEPRYEHGRPDWLRIHRHRVQGVVEPPGEHLVQLHAAGEGPSSTPVDQLLTGPDGQFELLVPPGDYLLRVCSRERDAPETRQITVTRSLSDLHISV
jgi:hypothetical protein